MKLIALGDTHGRVLWKEIVNKEADADKIVFIGDYFDTHDSGHSPNRQIENFKDIIEFKKANMDRVILLTGNHDFHYMKGAGGETYSGYQAGYAIDIREQLENALKENLLQMCYQEGKYFFSHAGVTMTWCADNEVNMSDLVDSINDLFKYKPGSFKFTSGDNYSQTGNDVTQPPIWVRPQSLSHDMVGGIVCVVGHTTARKMAILDNMILIDTLGTTGEYLTITDGVPSITK